MDLLHKPKKLLLHNRWPWHLIFWVGYALFRFWPYYITVKYYDRVYLEYMLLSELIFAAAVYFTLWLYRRLFQPGKYLPYFIIGTVTWIGYLYSRTAFQFYYLKHAQGFRGNNFADIVINNIALVIASFLFITACKYFKDGYIAQQFEAEKREFQLRAEVNNLKSQIAPHFLFNTLNNLYGLSVDRSPKLPRLMLRLSDLLRHSLYETQKPLVPLRDEINTIKSYIELESIRLEDSLELHFESKIPENSTYQIAPLILIVFVENAFKHARLVDSAAVNILIEAKLEHDQFVFEIKNNYDKEKETATGGIGITNVKRRLEVLYPGQHELIIRKDDAFYTVILKMNLVKP